MKSSTLFLLSAALIVVAVEQPGRALTVGAPQQVSQSPAKPPLPADKAFDEARAIKDPQAKLAAFLKLRKDSPDSAAVKNGAADFNILLLTSDIMTTAAREARLAAERFSLNIPSTRDRAAWDTALLAFHFDATDSMWTETERYARAALKAWDTGDTTQPPLFAGQRLERAVPLALLGKAIARQGRDEEATRYLRAAFDARGDEPGVVKQIVPLLLDIAKRRGDRDSQLEYLMALALYGELTPERRTELETLFRGTHGGTIDGLEAMLDARYATDAPKAVSTTPFTRPSGAGNRTPLVEMFTGAYCGPCVGMDLALEAALRRYGPSDAAVIVYHLHSPSPDPLVNPSGEARGKSYGIAGAPHLLVNGAEMDDEGGGSAAEAVGIFRTRLMPAIEKGMAEPSGTRIELTPAPTPTGVRASVVVTGLPTERDTLKLHVALVEERVRFSGGNGIRFHPMVVRNMAGDGEGLPVAKKGTTKTEVQFDLAAISSAQDRYLDAMQKGTDRFEPFVFPARSSAIDSKALRVVAFVQDAKSHRVLQAVVQSVTVR